MTTSIDSIRLSLVLLAGCAAATGCETRLVDRVEHSFVIDGTSRIVLDHDAGDLTIIGEPERERLSLIAELRTNIVSERQDARARRAVRLGVDAEDETTRRIIATLEAPPPGYWLDVTVLAPSRVSASVTDGSGDLHAEGLAALVLDDDSGDASIVDIAGDISVRDDSGDLSITGALGDVDVSDDSGDLSIAEVGGAVTVTDGSGDLAIEEVGGAIDVDDGSGDISVRDAASDVAIVDDSGDIRVDRVGDLEIDDGSGDIRVDGAGTVIIRDGSGDISVRDAGEVHIDEDSSGDVDIQ